MAATIHANARTTPKIRAEIQAAPPSVSNAALARRFGVTKATVAKWRRRDQVHDGSHRPHRLNTTLTEAQEAVVVAVRELLLLPLDDLLVVAWEFLNPNLSRSALDRCLRRHGVNNLKAMLREQEGEAASDKPYKSFKDYEPGFVHVDIKYLPQMAGESLELSDCCHRPGDTVGLPGDPQGQVGPLRRREPIRDIELVYQASRHGSRLKIAQGDGKFERGFLGPVPVPLGTQWSPEGCTHHRCLMYRCPAHGIEHRPASPDRPQSE